MKHVDALSRVTSVHIGRDEIIAEPKSVMK